VLVNWDEVLGWGLAVIVGLGLFLGMRAGWSPHRGYSFLRTGLIVIPILLKGAHSLSHRSQRWG
jgi:hypothetical protein